MSIRNRSKAPSVFMVLCLACSLAGGVGMVGGCDKSSSSNDNKGPNANATVVPIPPIRLKPDGTIDAEGLALIDAQSGTPNLTVAFVRCPLTDAGLMQLAKYPNLRRVEAVGSKVTDKGIEKLKATNAQVEVVVR